MSGVKRNVFPHPAGCVVAELFLQPAVFPSSRGDALDARHHQNDGKPAHDGVMDEQYKSLDLDVLRFQIARRNRNG